MRVQLSRKSLFLTLIIVTVIFIGWATLDVSMLSTAGRNKPKRARHVRKLWSNITHSYDTFAYLAREANSSDLFKHQIPVDRDVPDTRSESCRTKTYHLEEGLKTSVIITFCNESRSALLRTLTSILNRTPHDLLEEIIVIDDYSAVDVELEFLRKYHRKIYVFRNDKHEGLIQSRNIGAQIAVGHYLVFLDSHCEVNVGWLEPLIHKVEAFKGTIVSPILDVIDGKSLQYRTGSTKLKGGFDWNLQFKWIGVSEEELESRSFQENMSYRSPTIPGGVFLINREWFFQLHGFNSNLKVYGGESLELSLKTWMCGGQIEISICSRVGHVFRRKHSFEFPDGIRNTMLHNKKCIAESWLDDYKFFYYSLEPNAQLIQINSSSIESAKQIKQSLQCRSILWYLQNVFQELRIPSDQNLAFGELKNGKKCLEVDMWKNVIVDGCVSDATRWFFTESGTLSNQEGDCLTFSADELKLMQCKSSKDQIWIRKRGNLIHRSTGKCLDNVHYTTVFLSPCHQGAQSQIWYFSVEIEELTK